MFDLWGQVDRGRLTHDLVNSQVHDFVDFAIALSYETRVNRDKRLLNHCRWPTRFFHTFFGVRNQHSRDHPRQARCVSQHTKLPARSRYLRSLVCKADVPNERLFYRTSPIYTTIGELPAKSCPQKALLRKLSTKFDEFLAVRSWRRFLCAYMLPIRDLCAIAFCICPLFFTTKNHKLCGISTQMRCLRCSFRVRCRHRSSAD